MKTYKSIDILLQLSIILNMVIGGLVGMPGGIFAGIFILGFLQIVSVLVHLSQRSQPWISPLRKIYYWLLLLPVGGFVLALFQESEDKYDMAGLQEMIFVLGISILIALYYLIVCFIELRKMNKLN
jgi:hypothetical protein